MADTGDGQTLLGGGGGEQCPGTAEQDPFQLPLIQLIQKISTEGDGAASTAGPSGMNVLNRIVEDKGSAINYSAAGVQFVSLAQFHQYLFADLSQIPCYDQIEILGRPAQVFHVRLYGLECSRGHCQV